MNRREMKRNVCGDAALILQNSIDAGWGFWDGLSLADADRYERALWDLIEELRRRGPKGKG